MKLCFRLSILAVAIPFTMSGCQEYRLGNNHKVDEEKVVETMNPSAHLDPAIDLTSDQIISIIIVFKTKPAKIAVIEAEAKGIPLTIEEAREKVEESHRVFQEELRTIFDQNQVIYKVQNTYKTALNGVSMELPANEIKRLAESSSVISKIHLNKKIQLDPPISPRYQK